MKKKILALFLATTAILSTFTACGSDESNDVSESSKSSVSSEKEESKKDKEDKDEDADDKEDEKDNKKDDESEADKKDKNKDKDNDKDDEKNVETTEAEEEKTTEAEKPEKDDDDNDEADDEFVSSVSVDDEEYIELLKSFYGIFSDKKVSEGLKLCFPESLYLEMEKAGMLQIIIDAMPEDLGFGEDDMDFSHVIVAGKRSADKKEVEEAEQVFSVYEGVCRALDNVGITFDMLMSGEFSDDDLTEEQQTKLMEDPYFKNMMGETDSVESLVEIELYEYVTFKADDKEEGELEIPFFKVKGEDVKIDVMKMGQAGNNAR